MVRASILSYSACVPIHRTLTIPGLDSEANRTIATRRYRLPLSLNTTRRSVRTEACGNRARIDAFAVDFDKARDEERFDGMWVLRTNTELSAVEVALRYKQLWMVEQIFRTAKSLLDTRPIFHNTDATICGHVFCSFLALALRDELFRRMDNASVSAEWDDILRDLNALTETMITYNGKRFAVRSNAVGVAGKIAQCVGVRLPNTVRQIDIEEAHTDPGL